MTTDTALALLRDAAGNLYMAYNAFTRNDAIAWEPLKETADRITALLDSGIKDAGDDVVEPYVWEVCGEKWIRKEGYDTLLSAYKRACVERDEAITRAADQVNTDTVSVPIKPTWQMINAAVKAAGTGYRDANNLEETDVESVWDAMLRAAQEGKK